MGEYGDSVIYTIQDFLCNLGMKPHMHLVEISIFSLNHVIVRPKYYLCTGFTDLLNNFGRSFDEMI